MLLIINDYIILHWTPLDTIQADTLSANKSKT